MRSAEKDRISTCLFSDRIAKASIAKYREITGHTLIDLQTVIAAVLIQKGDSLEVVSIGSGTKFLTVSDSPPGSVIRDLHAECLARRAFNRFLIDQISTDSEYVIFENEISKAIDDCKIHFYVSSQPCGNACIRKWAKSQKEVYDESDILPIQNHSGFSAHAIKEGQCALTFKKDSTVHDYESELLPDGVVWWKAGTHGILSCSDKIAIWNASGFLKRELVPYFQRINLSSITVGRKFVREHARRAFCCRLSGSKLTALNHPVIMCSAEKLDHSVIDTSVNGRAIFEPKCFMWSKGRSVEQIHHKTGLRNDGSCSAYSSESLYTDIYAMSLPSLDSSVEQYLHNKNYAKAFLQSVSVLVEFA